jgi:hypothetical protein
MALLFKGLLEGIVEGIRGKSAAEKARLAETTPETKKVSEEAKAYQEASVDFYQSNPKGEYTIPNKMNLSSLDAFAYGANLLKSQGVSDKVIDTYMATMFREQEQTFGIDSATFNKKGEFVENAHGTGSKRFREAIKSNYDIDVRGVTENTESPRKKVVNGSFSHLEGPFIRVNPADKKTNRGAEVTGFTVANKIGAQRGDNNPYDPTMTALDYLGNAKVASTIYSSIVSDDGQKVNINKWNPGHPEFADVIKKAENDLKSEKNSEIRKYLKGKLQYNSAIFSDTSKVSNKK